MVYNTSTNKYNLSDQKTPGRHPNSFLYRAHLNMNEEKVLCENNQALAVEPDLDVDEMAHHFQQEIGDLTEFGVQNEFGDSDLHQVTTCARPKRRQDLGDNKIGNTESQDLRLKSSCQKLQDQLQK